jgi:hypothetical protein
MSMTGRNLADRNGPSGTTVILEYAVDRANSTAIRAWAQGWIDLNAKTQNSSGYRVALEAITESVVKAGAGTSKSRANGSALNVIRVNESNDNNIWDLREFAISKSSHFIKAQTVAQTPNAALNQTWDLADWVFYRAQQVVDDQYQVSLLLAEGVTKDYPFTTKYLRGSHASTLNSQAWDFSADYSTRFRFAVNTCNGCHRTEGLSLALPFHIQGRVFTQQANISPFLSGKNEDGTAFSARDPRSTEVRFFSELERRRQDLSAYLSGSSLSSLAFQPLSAPH